MRRLLKRWWKRVQCFLYGHDPVVLKWTPPRTVCKRCWALLDRGD